MTIYFDMDGVLVKYDRSAYQGQEPLFTVKGGRYFRKLEPDERAVRAFQLLSQREQPLRILSSLTNIGSIFLEQYADKKAWIAEHLPGFENEDTFIPAITNKRNIAEFMLKRKLTINDVLIDDYNPNLDEWRNNGGLAIKYLNGINSADSFSGPIIDLDMTPEQIVDMLIAINYSLK